ncbi:MAG: hypothetical protein RL033_8071, partial [Pseudomonadota bacterium]
FDGARYATERSDQYSLGLVMYQCLTGRSPFSEQTSISLLRAVATGRLRPLRSLRPSVSRAAEKLVARALDVDPTRRFAHVRELGSALFALASPRSRVLWESAFGTPTTGGWAVSGVFSWPPVVPRSQLRPGVVLLAGIGLLIAAALLLQLLRPEDMPLANSRAALVPTTQVSTLPAALPPSPAGAPAAHAAHVSLVSPAESATDARHAGATGSETTSKREAARLQRAAAGERASAADSAEPNAPARRERRELEELFPAIGRTPSAAPTGPAPSDPPIPE